MQNKTHDPIRMDFQLKCLALSISYPGDRKERITITPTPIASWIWRPRHTTNANPQFDGRFPSNLMV